jgi:hypothetical protein
LGDQVHSGGNPIHAAPGEFSQAAQGRLTNLANQD